MIGQAIESVLAQTYYNWELIIVDDGSNDNTSEIISAYSANEIRIKYFYQKNKGRSAARNKGIEFSTGVYICFLDDDDYYLKNFLLEFYYASQAWKTKDSLLMCQQFEEINDTLIEIKVERKKLLRNPLKYLILKSNNLQVFAIPVFLLKSEKFDERFELGEDFHLLVRLMLRTNLVFIDKTTCVYRNHPDMTMERELKECLFHKTSNRLDMLEDLISKYSAILKSKGLLNDLEKKYNQIAYFYGSACLKAKNIEACIYYFKKIKLNKSFSYFYFTISHYFRLFIIKYKKNK